MAAQLVDLFLRRSTTPVESARIQGLDTRSPFIIVTQSCCRCGGTGVWRGQFSGTCFRCGGHGKTASDTRKVRVYTAEQNAKLDIAQAKRDAIAQAKRAAIQAAKDAALVATAAAFDATYAKFVERLPEQLLDVANEQRDAINLRALLAAGRAHGSWTVAQHSFASEIVARYHTGVQRAATSKYVGSIGERLTFDVTCEQVASFERVAFGARHLQTVWVCTFVTATGAVLVTKTPTLHVERGTVGTLVGTVKAHTTYREVQQTQLQCAKFTAKP